LKKILAAAGLAGLAAGAGLLLLLRPAQPQTAPAAPSAVVSVMKLAVQTLPVRVDAAGSVVADAPYDVTVAAPGILTGYLVRISQDVAAGQGLAEIAPDPQSVALLRKGQAALAAATAARAHVAALLAQRLATNADLAAASQNVRNAQADLTALQATGTGAAHEIVAPFAGTVVAISAAQGGLLQAGAVLLQLAPASGLAIRAGVPEADALRITQGDTATIMLLNTGATQQAKVAGRAAMLDPQTGLMNITLLPQDAVTLGEPVAVTIICGKVSGYRVPRAAVLSDEQGDYVYLLDAGNVAHRQNVHVLEPDGGDEILAPDFSAGTLATIGAYQLSDGMTATLQSTTR
jgi:RND family efflux transporter MFP subunit